MYKRCTNSVATGTFKAAAGGCPQRRAAKCVIGQLLGKCRVCSFVAAYGYLRRPLLKFYTITTAMFPKNETWVTAKDRQEKLKKSSQRVLEDCFSQKSGGSGWPLSSKGGSGAVSVTNSFHLGLMYRDSDGQSAAKSSSKAGGADAGPIDLWEEEKVEEAEAGAASLPEEYVVSDDEEMEEAF